MNDKDYLDLKAAENLLKQLQLLQKASEEKAQCIRETGSGTELAQMTAQMIKLYDAICYNTWHEQLAQERIRTSGQVQKDPSHDPSDV